LNCLFHEINALQAAAGGKDFLDFVAYLFFNLGWRNGGTPVGDS
jgi:hypothetical protein